MRMSLFTLTCLLAAAVGCQPSLTGHLDWTTEGGSGSMPLEGRYYADGALEVNGEGDDAYFTFYLQEPNTALSDADSGESLLVDFESETGDLDYRGEDFASFSWTPDTSGLHTRYEASMSSGPRSFDFYVEWHQHDDDDSDPGSVRGQWVSCLMGNETWCIQANDGSDRYEDIEECDGDWDGVPTDSGYSGVCDQTDDVIARCHDVPGDVEFAYYATFCDNDPETHCDDQGGRYVENEGC